MCQHWREVLTAYSSPWTHLECTDVRLNSKQYPNRPTPLMGRMVSPPRPERFAILTDEKHTSTFLNHLSHHLSISWILPVGCYHTAGWTKYNNLKLMFTLGSEFVAQKNVTFETFVYLWRCGLGCHGVDPFENWFMQTFRAASSSDK